MFNNRWGMNRSNCGCGRECGNQPIVEPTITNCVEKDFCQEVEHVCPIHTHTINRVHLVHTYRPEYSCSEETQVINEDNGGCCNFR